MLVLQSLKYFTAVLWHHQSKRIVINITCMCLPQSTIRGRSNTQHANGNSCAWCLWVRLKDVHLSEHVHGKLVFVPWKKEKRKVLISPSSEFPLSTSDYPAPSSSLADYESLQLYRLSSNFLMSQRHTALEWSQNGRTTLSVRGALTLKCTWFL